eukprot:5792634-Amphidinium_carterae.1
MIRNIPCRITAVELAEVLLEPHSAHPACNSSASLGSCLCVWCFVLVLVLCAGAGAGAGAGIGAGVGAGVGVGV